MKSKLIILIQFIIAMSITSCDFDDSLIEYEEQLVVFASINAGFPVSDTVYVSRTAGVSESTDAQDLYIDDANVKLINVSKLPLFNSYCLFMSSMVHKFKT